VIIDYFSAGGVELVAQEGKIKVINTLESRLALMSQQVSCHAVVVKNGDNHCMSTMLHWCFIENFSNSSTVAGSSTHESYYFVQIRSEENSIQ
jgi:ATP synthase (E/31 kDa) subunit